MAIANEGVAFMPNKKIQAFEEAIESIMMVFSEPDDFILMRRLPSSQFIDFYSDLGIALPKFILLNEALTKGAFLDLPKGKIAPWGWSPSLHRWLKPLNNVQVKEVDSDFVKCWQTDYKQLYSRQMARDVLEVILQQNSDLPFLSAEALPVICTTVDEIEALLNTYGKGVVKAPWSSSGRGIQMLYRSEMTPPLRSWLIGMFQQQKVLFFEQLQPKVCDLSFQFSVENKQATFLGYSLFYASSNGQYEGNFVNPNLSSLPKEVEDLFKNGTIAKTVNAVQAALSTSELITVYSGNLGVDLLLFNDDRGDIKINPCLEINLRYTMGMVALQLANYIIPEASGKYEMWFGNEISFGEFVEMQRREYPIELNDGKIVRGFLPLSSNWESSIGAYLLVD